MPRELITVQVGQAGNQIGSRFWELALKEHAAYNSDGLFDEAMSSFFRNVDSRHDPPRDLPVRPDKLLPIVDLKARAVVVDMEEGVVNSMLKGPLGELFDSQQLLTDVGGSGNNWAHGHSLYGPQYAASLADLVRAQAEACDSLQGFMLLHSLGGGTGSGLGSFILEQLEDDYPTVHRFATSVFPSHDDDVVTSPYNALLSLSRLSRHADCAFPLENQALLDICSAVEAKGRRGLTRAGSAVTGADAKSAKPYDAMNGIAANMLLNLTSSARFEGPLNVDLNEISMNLVPYPRQHFLLSSMSPLAAPKDMGKLVAGPRAMDQVFSDVFQNSYQLIDAEPRQHTYLACALLMRGNITAGDFSRVIGRIKSQITMAPWNADGFKTGICSRAPVGVPFSLLALANNCAVGGTFEAMQQRFMQLYRKRLYVHHYTEYMEQQGFEEALETVAQLAEDYRILDDVRRPPPLERFFPTGGGFGQNSFR
ncbi:hypothetical protein N2152v2_006998 [Parachlorella kessleri]